MATKPFVLPSGIDFYAGDGTAAGAADPLLVVADSTNKVGINSQTPSGTLDINIASGTDKGLIVRSFTGGTGNIFEAQSAASGTLVVIDASGELGINNPAPAAMLDITSRSATTMGTIIKAATSQSADILKIQNSLSTPLFTVNSAGRVGIGSGSQTPTGTLDVTSLSTSTQTAILRAVSGQTSNIFETKRFSNGITGLFTSFDVAAVSSNVNIRDDGYYPAISFYQLATTTPVNVVNLTGYNGLLIDGLANTSVGFRTTGVTYSFITSHPNLNNWLCRPLSISTTDLANNNDGASNIGNKAQLALQTLNRYFRGVMIRGSSPQNANLLEIQNSSSGVISYIDPSGNQSGISASYPSGITLSSGIPAVTTNKLYASGTNLFWNENQLLNLTPTNYVCQGKLTADQVIPTTSDTIIQFADDYDPQNWWNASTYRFQPTIAGYYTVSIGIWFTDPGASTGQCNLQARLNGNTFLISQSPLSFNGAGQSIAGEKIVYMNGTTDYIDFTAYQSTGSNKSIQYGTTSGSGSWFSIVLLTYGGISYTASSGVAISGSNIYMNGSGNLSQLQITSATTSSKPLIIKSIASQTANLFEVQNSAGSPILAITPSGSISGAISPTLLTSTGNLTLTDIHHGYIIEQTGVSASGTFTLGTITIPTWNCSIVNIGSGVIVASGSNTMRSPGGLNKSRTQYSSISIYRRGDGSFILGGDLA